MGDDTIKRIEELKRRHVEAAEGGTEGRMALMRQQHVEYAQSEAKLRARGVKLHVLYDQDQANFCPFYGATKFLITCLVRATNHTEPVCFGCSYPDEWAAKGGNLRESDYRRAESDWKPYKMVRYIGGTPTLVEYEPYVYCRVEEPDGEVWWFKRFMHGQVELDHGAHMDHGRGDTRWWDLGRADSAPRRNTMTSLELEHKKDAAEKRRFALARTPAVKKAKKKAGKKREDSGE